MERPDGRCTICTVPLNEKISAIRCGHVFHSECIDAWISSTPKCPLCYAKASRAFPLFIKLQASEKICTSLKQIVQSLEKSRIDSEKEQALEAVRTAKQLFDERTEQLDIIKNDSKSLKKEIKELDVQIEIYKGEKKKHEELNQKLIRQQNRMNAIISTDEAIQKVQKACRRAKIGEDFLEIPLQFSGENRVYILQKQLESLKDQAAKTSDDLKRMSKSFRAAQLKAKKELTEEREKNKEIENDIKMVEKETQKARQNISSIKDRISRANQPPAKSAAFSSKRERRDALASLSNLDFREKRVKIVKTNRIKRFYDP